MSPSPTPAPRRGCLLNHGDTPANLGRQFPAEVYTAEEMRTLLGAFSRRGAAGIRNCALTAVLYRCGLRISEALSAPLGDLRLDDGTLYVRFPKRDSKGRRYPRLVAIDAETAAVLERWLLRRRTLGIGPRAPLFCQINGDSRGQPMNATGYRAALSRAGERAGIGKRMHPHGMRHTFAFTWLQEGRPLDQLQVLLGHRKLATTAHYAQHLNPKAAIDAQRARQWDPPTVAPAELDARIRAVIEQLFMPA